MALHLGLTGGIGSGKSLVGRFLMELRGVLIDSDAVSRSVTAAGGAAIGPIRDTFGPDFIDAAGAMHRARMRTLAFSDPTARGRLEAIIHPLVQQASEAQARAAEAAGAPLLVFDIPLLVESGRRIAQFDRLLVVDCSIETQIARVMARNGLARGTVEGIIASQASRAQRLAAADAVLFNDGIPPEALRAQVHALAGWLGLPAVSSGDAGVTGPAEPL
ncbi:dephospho-CoA kinase [Xylophilus sp.]|uniref:dephospho-CoA kinase n=1 Tax=Xylophilus sp. TaxID=2653893 RepID=UPI0013BD6E88|nr:dephospho-CoA kinase [Xylophilus sp.]KAF1047925.1 MAG: Dephospho-CoA kinase [Xylophilus sp.]